MKITKRELIWLILVVALFVAYNLPGVPEYLNPEGTILHGCLTLIPLWAVALIGKKMVYDIYEVNEEAENEDNHSGKEDVS